MATPVPAWASKGWQYLVAQQRAGNLLTFQASADKQAEAAKNARGWDKWKGPAWLGGAWNVSAPGVRSSFYAHGQSGGAGGGGGTSGTGGGPGTSGSPPPASGVAPQITGGMESVEPGFVDNNVRLADRGPRFRGIDEFTPDEKVNQEKSPYCMNWNAIERAGSWCARRGSGRFIDDGTTCEDSGSSAINSAYKGLGFVPLELNDQNDDNAQHTCALLLAFTDTAPGKSGSINCCVVEPEVAWGHPASLRNMPGPDITLSQIAGPKLRVAASYGTNLYASRTGVPLVSVKGITIAYSTVRFPRDVDKRDERESKTITLFKDRASFNGAATNFDTGVLATGRYFVAVWAHTLEGTSEPSYMSLELT